MAGVNLCGHHFSSLGSFVNELATWYSGQETYRGKTNLFSLKDLSALYGI